MTDFSRNLFEETDNVPQRPPTNEFLTSSNLSSISIFLQQAILSHNTPDSVTSSSSLILPPPTLRVTTLPLGSRMESDIADDGTLPVAIGQAEPL